MAQKRVKPSFCHDDPTLVVVPKQINTAHFERVAVSISRSACPASSSTAAGGSEEQDELRRRMDEYPLHEEYYKSVRGEDGEEPLEALGSPPHMDMGSYHYSGPPTDLADTVSLPRRPRGSAWRPELPTTIRTPEVCPAYVEDSHLPGPTYGALDRTAELLHFRVRTSFVEVS